MLTRPPAHRRRLLALVSLVASLVLLLPFAAHAQQGDADVDVQPARVSGETRLETAAAIAGLVYPQGVAEALIAPSADFPEALAGQALAGALDAPVLLNPTTFLADTTARALADLGVQRVTILGDTADISEDVEQALAQDHAVTRIAGADDFDTAAMIAQTAADIAGGLPEVEGRRTLLLASGLDFPDALAASGPAFDATIPLLLTEPDALPPSTSAAIDALDPDHVIIVGGSEAVSDGVGDDLEARGILTTRLGGANRVETAVAVADHFVDDVGFLTRTTVLLARGDAFPDALTAGSLSGSREAPILLAAQPDLLTETTSAWLRGACPDIEVLQVVGGTDAVTPEVANGAEAAAESCTPTDPGTDPGEGTDGPTFQVSPQQAVTVGRDEAVEMTVFGRTGDQPFTGPVDIVLFPCASADVTGADLDTFVDADDDGAADGFGTTNTGSARIAVVNGDNIEDTKVVVGAEPGADGQLTLTLIAEEDCTVPVVVDGDGDGDLDVDGRGHPTEPYGVAKIRWVDDDAADGSTQTFAVAPMEPRTTDVGEPLDFSVARRYDDQPFTGPVDIILFPCENADILGGDPDTFADGDGDGAADGFGTTDTGLARIAVVNGTDIDDTTTVVGAEPDEDGALDFRLSAGGEDCTVPVVVDGDGDGDLDVDAQGHPTEPYGVGLAEWAV